MAKVVGPNRLTSSGCSLGTEPSRAREEASTRSCLLCLQVCTPAGPATCCLRQQRMLLLPGCLLLLLVASCMASQLVTVGLEMHAAPSLESLLRKSGKLLLLPNITIVMFENCCNNFQTDKREFVCSACSPCLLPVALPVSCSVFLLRAVLMSVAPQVQQSWHRCLRAHLHVDLCLAAGCQLVRRSDG